MEGNQSALLPALRDMFPSMPDDVLTATLHAHGNSVEEAIGALLEMCAGNDKASALTATTGGLAASQRHRESRTLQVNRYTNKQLCTPKSPVPDKSWLTPPAGPSHAPPAAEPRAHPVVLDGGIGQGPLPLRTPSRETPQLGPVVHHAPHPQPRQPHQKQSTAGPRPCTGWALGQPHAACHSLKYVAPGGGAAARLGATDFPDLAPEGVGGGGTLSLDSGAVLPVARSSSTVKPSHSASSLQVLVERVGSLSFTCGSASSPSATTATTATTAPLPRVSGRPLPVGYADAARYRAPPPQPELSEGSWARLAGARDHVVTPGVCGAGDAAAVEEGWQGAAVEELCRSHPWAARDLVEAVCITLQYDLTEVVAALDELNAASYQFGDAGRGASGSTAASSVSGSVSPADLSSESESDEERCREGDGARGDPSQRSGVTATAEAYDFSAQRGGLGGRAGGAAAPVGGGGGGGRRRRRRGGEASEAPGGVDAYSRHRRSALKLTHAWRKHMDKASAAFSAGDRALGRRLVAEAQELRRRAAVAHAEAAERIEAEMNQGRQLSEWELDLHGLHVNEAVEALAKRISALEPAPSAAAPAAAHTAGGGDPARRAQQPQRRLQLGGRDSGGGTAAQRAAVDAAPPAPPSTDAAAAAAKLLASRRVLRVIVGKGLHSSGGEASLPRVVESYLLGHGFRFTRYAGVIEVQLRRHFAPK